MSLTELAGHLAEQLQATLSDPRQLWAFVAAAVASVLIIVSAFVKTIIPLRWLAVGSNIGFIIYGLVYPAWLLLALHLTLLPVNLFRTFEMIRLTRTVTRSASSSDQLGIWLRPYMRRKKFKAGDMVFLKGDLADRLYFLAQGEIEFVEPGRVMEAGRMFGEIAFFAPDRRRTSSARCKTACLVLTMDETTFRQLYFQNPAFGFEVVRLIAGRLTEDVRRLEERLSMQTGTRPVRDDMHPADPAA